MKYRGVFLLLLISISTYAQNRPKPFELAREAIELGENEEARKDSLKKCFAKRWSLDFIYGQRFISPSNQTDKADTITLTDFSQKRGFFGLGGSYFLTDRIMLGGTINFLILPKKQEVNSFTGSGGSGSGSGGLSLNFELLGRYYFGDWKYTRPFVSAGVGRYQMIAKGGEVEFSLFSGRDEDINELNSQVLSANVSAGVSHRLAPGSMLDFTFGYTVTSRTEPIGGITSPGGINSSLSIRFILNPKKKNK